VPLLPDALMPDLLMLLLIVGSFALLARYLLLCERG
jgi:hypothetical protein